MNVHPIRCVLVANRGEIAVRVVRACRELGIATAVVYSEGEAGAVHARSGDAAYRLDSTLPVPYLDIAALLEAAQRAGADAVHPGYGYLAENADFAEACAAAGLIFIGPSANAIRSMGHKVTAKAIARGVGVPVVEGSDGAVVSVEAARECADQIGYPIAVKASGGGGGRGFRVARNEREIERAFVDASSEAGRYFANPDVFIERYVDRPRHVEVQILGDAAGRVVALGERDCSLQRRHQKLVEETPSPGIDDAVRAALSDAAVSLARKVDYLGAGTIEFLVDEAGQFFFLEMNTRIQVEHTVTEMVTGVDLVKEQIRIAQGLPLSFDAVEARGHAIQCRINAEDPGRGFAPSPGTIQRLTLASGPGVRVDTAMEAGSEVLPAFDSMIAKLAVWGRDREEAISRMRRALDECRIEGVATTLAFDRAVMRHPVFVAGDTTTAFLVEHPEVIPLPEPVAAEPERDGARAEIAIDVDGRRFTVRAPVELFATARPRRHASPRSSSVAGAASATKRGSGDGPILLSPIQGTVRRIAVTVGQNVERGEIVCVIEAMKMENEVLAQRSGVIASIAVSEGDRVGVGAPLVSFAETSQT